MEATNQQQDVFRPLAHFPPSIWGTSFASFSSPDSEFESYTKRVEALKENVKDMLTQSTKEIKENIEFINLLCRLGVSYHFENEIDEQLNHSFIALPDLLTERDYDLCTVALIFRVLRQHGYEVSCDVFNKFKDSDGEFKKSITDDVKGLLNLYEASFLSVHGEDILDEALVFTKKHLQILAEKSSPHLAQRIKNALYRPLHHELERLETRHYITFYEAEDSKNETLLQFAKLDYNRLQILYKQELAWLSRWWKELDIPQQLPYVRDRLVEIYIYAIGAHFEPQYAFARLMISQYANMTSLLDDTYDAYGTLEELDCFTTAMQRFDISSKDELSGYTKNLYEIFLKLYDETEENDIDGMSYKLPYLKDTFSELSRKYMKEAKWFYSGTVPPFNEYIRNGLPSTAYNVLPAASFLGMDIVGVKEIEWVKSKPKIVEATKFICRVMDDITSHEHEQARGDCPSSVECYMKEHGVTDKEAIEELQKMCANAWKDINKDSMKPNVVPSYLLKYYANLSRVIDFIYKYQDSYTFPSYMKDDIQSLFLDELPM